MLAETEDSFDFNVTRYRHAKMYKEMGLGVIGYFLSCNRDGSFCEGYSDNITMQRDQTIASGASRCDFRYRYEGGKGVTFKKWALYSTALTVNILNRYQSNVVSLIDQSDFSNNNCYYD